MGYVQPAWDMSSRVQGEVKTLQAEFDRLSVKVKEKETLIEQKRRLDKDIQRMRSSVPARPEMDILLMDIERLSAEAGTDLIAIEPPVEKKSDKGDNIVDSIMAEVGGRMRMTPKANRTAATTKPIQPGIQHEEASTEDPLGIKHVERRVYVTGSYNDLMKFLKRLEAYQRIVGIRSLIVSLPESSDRDMLKTLASDKGRTLELDQPVMTFLMSVYYLP